MAGVQELHRRHHDEDRTGLTGCPVVEAEFDVLGLCPHIDPQSLAMDMTDINIHVTGEPDT